MAAVKLIPSGRVFVRQAIVKAMRVAAAVTDDTKLYRLADRWGANSDSGRIAKAAIGGYEIGDVTLGDGGAAEFFGVVQATAIIGQMRGIRLVGFNTPTIRATSRAVASWVRERGMIRVRKQSFARGSIERRKVAALQVASMEAMEDPRMEEVLQADMVRSSAEAIDAAFIDAANVGVAGEMPASITAAAPQLAATGDPVADFRALVGAFEGDLMSAYVISDPLTLLQLNLWRDAGGIAPFLDVGARGGLAGGLPAIASTGSPRNTSGGQIALVDAAAVAFAGAGGDVVASQDASIVMSDDPESTGESGEFTSLFHEHAIALKVTAFANWELQRAGAVAVLTGCDFTEST